MTDAYIASFIKGMPKAELHLHVEGSLEPELMFELAQRNGITPGSPDFPFRSVAEVREAYRFTDLQDFLDIYYQGANVIRTERDFYDLAMAYFERANEDNVRHAEIFFDPQTHTGRGIPYSTVINGLSRATHEAQQRFGMSVYLIHSFLRHLSEEAALASLDDLQPYLRHQDYPVIGVGLDSSEVGHPPKKFAQAFQRARSMGLHLMAHAGEEGPPEYVREALDILRVERIDHGNRSLEDAGLTGQLVAMGMTLTVCPLSNEKLRVVPDLKKHPIPLMLRKGLNVTINSDDPAYFGGYIADNYLALASRGLINRADCLLLASNSIRGSFLESGSKNRLLEEIAAYSERSPMPSGERWPRVRAVPG